MLSPFICGSFNHHHHHQEEEDRDSSGSNSPCSTPRKSKKSSSKDSKNPYSNRGLDKFSALLDELEQKRQKIYSQVGSEDISFVRFVYSSSNDVVPIVVKLKDQNNKSKDKDDNNKKDVPRKSTDAPKDTADTSAAADQNPEADKESGLELDKKTVKKKKVTWNLKLHKWRRPSYYVPAFIILILLFLVFFGRSAAILCTSIGWYVVPALSNSSQRPSSKPEKKKQLLRRFSEISPPSRNIIDDPKVKSPHNRQNSF